MIRIDNQYGLPAVSQKAAIPTGANSIFTDLLVSKAQPKINSIDDIFEKASKEFSVPVSLLKAVGKAESNFDPKAQSHSGAQGIMQLMPSTARSLGVTDSFDAEQNIMGGAKYLSQLLTKYDGNVKLALAAYNAGSGNVAKYGGIPPFKETQNYVNKVMNYAGEEINVNKYITPQNNSDHTMIQPPSYYNSSNYTNEILSFQNFTKEDYLLFINYLKASLSTDFSVYE